MITLPLIPHSWPLTSPSGSRPILRTLSTLLTTKIQSQDGPWLTIYAEGENTWVAINAADNGGVPADSHHSRPVSHGFERKLFDYIESRSRSKASHIFVDEIFNVWS